MHLPFSRPQHKKPPDELYVDSVFLCFAATACGADGSVLYPTHHFEEEELRALLEAEGLRPLHFAVELEASSRRPDQAARFFYVVAEAAEAVVPEAIEQV
mmetsp:Transcript_21431/g.67566  ORF Transcript_21431/g.67566 Transcript_21431/m.67566 type:complete len:100 (-) Transcript_21431:69-368(-)